jgi:predicted nucleotidyltransferase component of viral defense system
MTGIDELKRIAGREKVGLGVIERDHATTIALLVLSRTELSESMVFKGGTAIKKMFYPKTRFSEDLDFNCEHDIAKDLERQIEKPLIKNEHDVAFTGVREEKPRSPEGRRLRFEYNDMNGYRTSIRVDLAFRERTVMKPGKMKVKNPYRIRNIAIRTMRIEEIMAEKVRALIVTGKPRHLYDLWFLLRRGMVLNKPLINKKLKLYSQTFNLETLRGTVKDAERDWETDLQALLPVVSRFSNVERYVMDRFQHEFS